ncbi:RsmE family RNA methyltransferase [Candidatus Uabimicrobium amorphum]|uniref:Ribosomal RNA small subunit methyltransferase E n=1 Tax=Uabimicrobium amorphum TaxID=2596890 RepID=A0A5S9IPI9_UABAM|nr:RsmE family RNA methyltransferase [Candidatus Uabimicrobium amorphum]BBM85317.1 ribosomal RNA small subunit methyltransferase E [Candidatus Uabimicrobium amorphum]
MSHFFVEKQPQDQDNQITIEGPEANHIINARRAQIGEEIKLFDKSAHCYHGKIISIAKKKVCVEIVSRYVNESTFPIKLNLAQALVKSKKWDMILQTSMELGLQTLTPMMSERVAAGINTAGRRERWSKVILAAAKQSERPYLLDIKEMQTFSDILQDSSPTLVAHTDPQIPSMHTVLKSLENVDKLTVIIGPEGGFSNSEIQQAQQHGAKLFSLGKQILRAETATAAIIANIHFYFS